MTRLRLRLSGAFLAALGVGCGDDGTSSSADETSTGGTDPTMTQGPSGTTESTSSATTMTSADTGTTAPDTGSSESSSESTGAPNEPPEAVADFYLTNMDEVPLTIAADGVLGNDSDPDGDTLTIADFDASSTHGGGVELDDDGGFTYTPPGPPFWGDDRFSYTISDGNGREATAEVRIMVAPTTFSLGEIGDVAGDQGGFSITGTDADGEAGWSVAATGDIDGDGLADLVLGAPEAGDNGEGVAYVVFGKVDATAVDLASIEGGAGGFQIVGEEAGDAAGFSVAVAGDANGDGLDDIVVGAPYANELGGTEGKAYVVFGKSTTTEVDLSSLGAGGFTILGANGGDAAGYSAGAAGDVNGDGLADIALSAPGASADDGEAYVVFGRSATVDVGLCCLQQDSTGFAMTMSGGPGDAMAVGGAGDVNADGLADVIVGMRLANPNGAASGQAFVVFGKSDSIAVLLPEVGAGSGGFAIEGEETLDNAGQSVAGAGDVDGDGRADIIIGAPGAEDDLDVQGRSYVVFGKEDTAVVALSEIATGSGGFVIDGEAIGDLSGWSVGGAGDVNADGLADLVIGAQSADFANPTAGRAYIVFGKADTVGVLLSEVAAGDGGFAGDGEGILHVAGWSADGDADVNGDGFDDVIVGAYRASSSDGRAYVLFGGDFTGVTDGLATEGDDTLTGTANVDFIVGGRGDDALEALGDADVLYGGAGDDVIIIDGIVLFRIDGGTGNDTLRLDGAGIALDLDNYFDPVLVSMETIDLTGSGDNDLFLTVRDLRAISSPSHALTVIGDDGDSVVADLTNASFADLGPSGQFTEYSNGVLTLFVHEDLDDFVSI